MKIGNHLRDLVISTSECVMMSKTKLMYKGETYTFNRFAQNDLREISNKIMKLLRNNY